MSATQALGRPAALSMNVFERWLTLWVGLCIVAGITLGQIFPAPFHALGNLTVAQVNLPIAALVWLMVIPMLLKIDLAALGQVRAHWRGIAVTVGVNWLVKPFSMALLGAIFIGWLFRPLLPAGQVDSYIAGLILLAAAPCTAMVFVWSNLLDGEPHFTLSQVALNDTIMVVAFAPLVGLLLGLSSITVPWGTLILSVVLYIVVPVIVAQLWRRGLLRRGPTALARTLAVLGPVSLVALLATLVLLFGLQGEQIIAQPLVILLLAVPILIQVYFNAGLAYVLNRRAKVAWLRGWAVRPDRRQQLLRAGGRHGHRAVRLPVRRSACDRGGRADRSAGDAVRGRDRAAKPGLVRTGCHLMAGAVTIFHNPACGTSRNTLAMIRATGAEPVVIEYLKTPPSRAELRDLVRRMGIPLRAVLRQKGTPFAELGLGQPGVVRRRAAGRNRATPDPHQPADRGHAQGRPPVPAV